MDAPAHIQSEFTGKTWLAPGVLPTSEALRDRINALLPHEAVEEKSSFTFTNPTLRKYFDKIFHIQQLAIVYTYFNTQIPSAIIADLALLDKNAPDVLERAIQIIEGNQRYKSMKGFDKLERIIAIIEDSQNDEEDRYWEVPRGRNAKVSKVSK